MKAMNLDAAGRTPSGTYPKGRRCDDCSCVLSIYNPDKVCRPCAGPDRKLLGLSALSGTYEEEVAKLEPRAGV